MTRNRMGILVGGGPAPGINSVISAATIRSLLEGVEVLGIQNGFEWLMKGDVDHAKPLSISDVSQLHFRGGSFLRTSRANPTSTPEALQTTVDTLEKLGISSLVTIGGDDTAFSAMTVANAAKGRIRVVHVPKTIDNDLDLPPHVDTFGYQTARHVGVELVKNVMVDAKTTGRWYFIIAMGRKAGHLALGIGKAAGATLTLIPEEFRQRPIPLKTLVDTLVGAIIKRSSSGRRYGVAVIAEGVALSIDPADISAIATAERDEHGHIRIAEVDIGEILRTAVNAELKKLNLPHTLVSKNIGYELRCADPIPADMEYTRDLGYCASKYLLAGGSSAMISLQAGQFVPVPFAELLDEQTGRARVRMVEITSARYAIARRYMIRLRRDDFQNEATTAELAGKIGVTPQEFRDRYEYLTADEEPPLSLLPKGS